jgi:HK97 family phage portal protein
MEISSVQSGRAYEPDTSPAVLVEKYQGYVYACANRNAQSCAEVPLRLYDTRGAVKQKEIKYPVRPVAKEQLEYMSKSPTLARYVARAKAVEEIVEEHPLLDLLWQVNPWMNAFDLREVTTLSQELTGNSYWFLLIGPLGVPVEIWPLLPQYVRPITDKKDFITGYKYTPDPLDPQLFSVEEIIHFRYMGLKNSVLGVGPLEAAVLAADLHYNMNKLETTMMMNGGRPDIAMVLPADAGFMSPEQKKRLRLEWRQKYGGPNKAGRLAILEGGAELKDLTPSPREMAFLTGRKATRAEVAAIFGVPESKISVEDVNRANAEAGNYTYQKDTVLPKLRRIEQKLNERLIPLFSDTLFVAFDNPVPSDKDYRLKQVETHLKSGYASVNEERAIDGREPVPWGTAPILPMTMVPLGSAPPAVPGGPKEKAPRRLPPLAHPTNFVNEPLARKLSRWYADRAEEFWTAFNQAASELTRSFEYWDRWTKAAEDDLMGSWLNLDKWFKDLDEAVTPYIRFTLLAGAKKALASVVTGREISPMNPLVIKALEDHRIGSLRNIIDTTTKEIREEIARGMAARESLPQIRKRLETKFDSLERYRATLIARTETIWAWNRGATIGWSESGVVHKKVWIASGDTRTCGYCPQMDGKTIEITDVFWRKGDEMAEHPEDPKSPRLKFTYEEVGHPPLHPHCRCSVGPVVEEI